MPQKKFAKNYIFCVILSVTLFSLFYNLNYFNSKTSLRVLMPSSKPSGLKFLLIWTSNKTEPLTFLGTGLNTFKNRRCSFTNCYVSSNRKLLKDVTDFDVVFFHGPELRGKDASFLPQSRSPHQKYVFASMESSAYYPICNKMFNSYFNWTWTYKFNSDEFYGYMIIRDKEGKVVGPKEVMHWEKVEEMMPINDTLKAKLNTKKIAAAWFVSNCKAPSRRDLIAKQLQIELANYNMQVDIFGKCGTMKCPRGRMEECLQKLETDYYFYLSFENSLTDDYVTEKLLTALKYYTVPVVFGGANYTRFMPDGIYLSAQNTSIRELAKQMANAIEDKQKYYDFFKWHNHYSYHDPAESPETDVHCNFCALVNNKEKLRTSTVYEDFTHWWSPPHMCH